MTRLHWLPLAVQEGSSNPFDWSHPWSYSRILATVVFVVLSFLLAFGLYFRARLNPERDVKSAPWPLDVFRESMIVGIILTALSFLLFFAWLEDDLRRIPFRYFPSSMKWANQHGWELVVVVLVILLCIISRFVWRHRDTGPRKAN